MKKKQAQKILNDWMKRNPKGHKTSIALLTLMFDLESRVGVIEAWIDKWEGIGKEAYDSGWVKYREAIKKLLTK